MEGSGKTDLERVRDIYDEWRRGDYSGHTEIFHPEMAAETFGMGEPIRSESYEEFLDNMREWLSTWERPLTIEAEDFIQAGDRILTSTRWRRTQLGSHAERLSDLDRPPGRRALRLVVLLGPIPEAGSLGQALRGLGQRARCGPGRARHLQPAGRAVGGEQRRASRALVLARARDRLSLVHRPASALVLIRCAALA